MALALLFEDNSVLYLDAVTNYGKSRSSNISNHPIDAASVITDHISKNNPTITIRGIVSAADFQRPDQRPLELLESTEFNIDSEYNNPAEPATIKQRSNLLSFLPGSVQQFLGNGTSSAVDLEAFRGYSHQAARDKMQKAWDKSERLTLLDYDYDVFTGRSVSVRSFPNVVISRYEDNEEVETGDALEFNLTLQKVRLATIKEIDIAINQQPSSEVSDETSSEDNKGDQSSASEQDDTLADYLEREAGEAIQSVRNLTGFGG